MLHKLAFILLVIGGLNWGLEVLGYGVASFLPANISMLVYVLVALSAIYEIFAHKSMCRACNPQGSMM
ncbi:MAG TPA: DUF378 domain-containing protein [Candidatus Paceibacterota bacterium]